MKPLTANAMKGVLKLILFRLMLPGLGEEGGLDLPI